MARKRGRELDDKYWFFHPFSDGGMSSKKLDVDPDSEGEGRIIEATNKIVIKDDGVEQEVIHFE